jgi:signal transduction histidine kinase
MTYSVLTLAQGSMRSLISLTSTYRLALIEDLRLLSMAEAGNLRLNLEPCSLEELLSQSVENARPGALAKGVELEIRIPSRLPLVPVDRTRISQVVGNLLENSILHTPVGGTITVLAQADADDIRVTVADTGEGIPESALPFVFDRFIELILPGLGIPVVLAWG